MRDRLLLILLLAALSLACRSHSEAASPPPAPTPAPAPSLPKSHLTRADRAPWRQALAWPADCEQAFQDSAAADAVGIEVYPLSAGRSLVEVRCAWGAYQGSQIYYLYDETGRPPKGQPLTFEIRESPDERSLVPSETREVWGLPAFDPKTGELVVLDKFRGPGDCGTLATYRFENGRPRLALLRAKTACDGTGADEPEKWPEVPLSNPGGNR